MVIKPLSKYSTSRLKRLYEVVSSQYFDEVVKYLKSEAFLEVEKILPSSDIDPVSSQHRLSIAKGMRRAATLLSTVRELIGLEIKRRGK